jgi:hypothetical protein
VGASWSSANEQSASGIYTHASSIEGLPALGFGVARNLGDGDIRLDVNPTVYESVSGVSLPLGLSGTLEFEREKLLRFDEGGAATLSLLGGLSFERFSQTSVDTTSSSESSVFVPRTTQTVWIDFGPKLRFQLGSHDGFVSLTGGKSLSGSTSANDSAGTETTSLGGYRIQAKAMSMVTGNFYVHAEYEDVSLSSGDPSLTMSDFQAGIGARF